MRFATVRSYPVATSGCWTVSVQPGDLNSESEYVGNDFKSLEKERARFNPVLAVVGQKLFRMRLSAVWGAVVYALCPRASCYPSNSSLEMASRLQSTHNNADDVHGGLAE